MPVLHDPNYCEAVRARLNSLTPESRAGWGQMSVDQMLWHVNTAMEQSLGRFTPPPSKIPIPKALLKFFVLNLPWGKGAPTNPSFVAREHYDFDVERARCLKLVDELAARDIRTTWPTHSDFGNMSGRNWSGLMAKHLDHHLKQFGA